MSSEPNAEMEADVEAAAEEADGQVGEGDLVAVPERFLAEKPLRYEDITASVIQQPESSVVALKRADIQSKEEAGSVAAAAPSDLRVPAKEEPPAGKQPRSPARRRKAVKEPPTEEQEEVATSRGRGRRRRRRG